MRIGVGTQFKTYKSISKMANDGFPHSVTQSSNWLQQWNAETPVMHLQCFMQYFALCLAPSFNCEHLGGHSTLAGQDG